MKTLNLKKESRPGNEPSSPCPVTRWWEIWTLHGVHASKDLIRLSAFPVHGENTPKASDVHQVRIRQASLRPIIVGFQNKFEKKTRHFYSRILSPYIIRKYRIHSRNISQQHWSDPVTFEEFLDYVLEEKFDRHWKPFHLNCLPCRIKYDIIGKLETMDEDARQVLTRLGADHINFPRFNTTSGRTFDLIPSYFSTLTPIQIQRLHEIYKIDFEMFEYTHPGFNMSLDTVWWLTSLSVLMMSDSVVTNWFIGYAD